MANNGTPTQFANICLECAIKIGQTFLLSKFSLATLNTSFLLGNFSPIAARRLETIWLVQNCGVMKTLRN